MILVFKKIFKKRKAYCIFSFIMLVYSEKIRIFAKIITTIIIMAIIFLQLCSSMIECQSNNCSKKF